MRTYLNKPIQELAVELTAGLLRLRKGYVDSADALIRIINPAGEYPLEFVVYRLTGFRPDRQGDIAQAMPGQTLRADLQQLILDICESFPLRTTDYAESCLDIPALSERFHVSSKTIQRWQRQGLPARRLVFPDGKRRVAFTQDSVEWFADRRRSQVLRSMKFTKMTAVERNDIIRRARRMASFTHCTLNEVAHRLSARTGRAVETIRYSIRNYDQSHPDTAIFPYLSGPISGDEKEIIYRCFLNGVTAPALAEKYRRTRGSIYRIVNEMRAMQLLARPIGYIYNPSFDLPNADEIVAAGRQATAVMKTAGLKTASPEGGDDYFHGLYQTPLLDAQQERELFRGYNYLKYKADRLRKQIDTNHIRAAQLKQVESLLLSANVLKNQIIKANLRLVVSIAKKHTSGPQSLLELISDGNVSLMKGVEKFDYSRGYRFSTYASWAIMRNFARTVPREQYRMDRFATGREEVLDIAASLENYDPNTLNLGELRESLDGLLAQLTPRERTILIDHYGLDRQGEKQTFDQLGRRLGLSKERVRQIELRALDKLRLLVGPQDQKQK